MNRIDFQKISKLRVQEARTLLDNEHWQGAYYLVGYAVECALKSCVSKQIQKHSFPDKKFIDNAHTHSLEKLIKLSGLETNLNSDMQTNETLSDNWSIVTRWNESLRYRHDLPDYEARRMFDACTKRHGILPWIKRRW